MKDELLISIQRALWGMIFPEIRAIAVGCDDLKKLTVIYYLDREPIESDYDNISEVTTEVCADIAFESVEEICIFTEEPINKLNNLMSWVYVRQEGGGYAAENK